MKIQPCPSCGARYNVARLGIGAQFHCRRCDTTVVVGTAAEEQSGLAPGLAVTGFLMVATAFLYANPSFGQRARWPWEEFDAQSSPLVKVTFFLWFLTGLWALFTALAPMRQLRAAACALFSALLLTACVSRHAGFTVTIPTLAQMLAMIVLASGFMVARTEAHRRVGRLLAFAGGALLIVWHAVVFDDETGYAYLELLVRDGLAAIGGETDELSAAAERQGNVWGYLVPTWTVLVSALMGVLTGLGVSGRLWCWIGFGVLAAGLCIPVVSAAVQSETGDAHAFSALALHLLVAHGLALWLLGTFTVVDLVRAREVTA
jgi:hypothetical protein